MREAGGTSSTHCPGKQLGLGHLTRGSSAARRCILARRKRLLCAAPHYAVLPVHPRALETPARTVRGFRPAFGASLRAGTGSTGSRGASPIENPPAAYSPVAISLTIALSRTFRKPLPHVGALSSSSLHPRGKSIGCGDPLVLSPVRPVVVGGRVEDAFEVQPARKELWRLCQQNLAV